jgi:hypothetical protein
MVLATAYRMAKRKFMLTLVPAVYQTLIDQADERGISIQELLRAVIVPQWLTVPPLPEPIRVPGPVLEHVGNRWPKD